MKIGEDYHLKKSLHNLAFKKDETTQVKRAINKKEIQNLTLNDKWESYQDYTPFLENSEGKYKLVAEVANQKHLIFELPNELNPIDSGCYRRYFDDPPRFYTLVKVSPKRIALFSKTPEIGDKKGYSLLFHLGIKDSYKVKVKEGDKEILQEKKYEFICTTIIKYTYAKDKPKKLKVYLVTLTTDLKIRLFDIMGLLNMKKTFSVESADHIEFEKIVEFEDPINKDKNLIISDKLNEEVLKINDPRINRSKKKQKEISITFTYQLNKQGIPLCIERKLIGGPQNKTDSTDISELYHERGTDLDLYFR